MTNIIISDFRGNQLRQCENSSNFVFITDDQAELSWFENSATTQLHLYSLNKANIIIMLGLNDCVYSCSLATFDLNSIITDYVNMINGLIAGHANYTFYVCTIGPVDGDYYFADKVILSDTLNEKIIRFNEKLHEMCDATVIDCYSYLNSTCFYTRDGIRYLPDTCDSLLTYISACVNSPINNSQFKARLKAPVVNDDVECDIYWLGKSYGGLNVYEDLGQSYAKCAGDTLPNSTAYAWGRFYELLGYEPNIKADKVEQWYTDTSDGYKRGQTPSLGAIMCWSGTNAAAQDGNGGRGHVAVVEKVNYDGSVMTSESSWGYSGYWHTVTRAKGTDKNWGMDSNYTFQGFIYSPLTTAVGTNSASNVSKSQVICKDVALTEAEQKINAQYIWQYLGAKNWTLNAVAGMLGNMTAESTVNPGRGEIGGSGFGLVQWTPKSKYTSWSSARGYADNDIDGQLERIIWERDNNEQYYKNKYKYTFKEFSESTDDPYTLACAFAFDYERSGVASWGFHQKNCTSSCPSSSSRLSIRCRSCYEKVYGSAAAERQAEINKQDLRDQRGGSANNWYEFLAPHAPGFTQTFTVAGLKIDDLTDTTASASFISRRGSEGTYSVFDSSETLVTSGSLDTKLLDDSEDINVISFNIAGLIPNTQYNLVISVTSNNSGGSSVENSVPFTTPQSYPSSVKTIELIPNDKLSPHKSFKLDISDHAVNFGYWKSNGHGYIIQLVVNGRVLKEKNVQTVPKTINIVDYFNYEAVLTDIIQIGIRTWVKDNDGQIVYDDQFAKTSNPICMLTKPVIAYLKTD